jgi:hypothetical protein
MSAERKEWDPEELELLQHVKTHNATAQNEYITILFNEKNSRKRTEHAVRFRLKKLRKLAGDSVVVRRSVERSSAELRDTRDDTDTRDDGTAPINGTYPQHTTLSPTNLVVAERTIIIPNHPLIISGQTRGVIGGCDELSIQRQSNPQLAPRHDDLDWYLELPKVLGCNYGAFSITFGASLTGIMWQEVLNKQKISVRHLDFARVNLPIIIFAMIVSCAALVGEVYVVRSEAPYML